MCKKSIPTMTSVVSYGKTPATISREHGAESSLYTPNVNPTAPVVITLLPSANVTINIYLVLIRYPTALAIALVMKL